METKPIITYEDFSRADLRVAKIIEAERVTGSDKLLKLKVMLANSEERQIIAGLGKKYDPADLVGQSLVVIVNLEPRQLMGLESNGMVLAADREDGPVVLSPIEEVLPGAIIK